MKRKLLIVAMSLVLSIGMITGCGGNSTAVEADSAATAAEETDTASESADVKEAEEEADVAQNEKQSEEATKESTDSQDAEADEAADKTDEKDQNTDEKDQKAEDNTAEEADGVQIDWDDVEELEAPVAMYAQRGVNVRKGPGTEYDKVGFLKLNDEISVIGQSKSNGWKEVKYKDEVAFVSGSFLGTEQVAVAAEPVAEAAAPAAPAQQPAEPAQPAAPAVAQTTKVASSSAGILFIGDSRTAQMRDATGGGKCGWVCAYSAKYSWFESEGVPQADPLIGPGTKVVICMGVNDPGSVYSYANLVNQKAAEWVGRGAKVYYVSVNPVDHPFEDKYEPIDNFNAIMPGQLSNVAWIDTASVIKQGGFVLEDGIHYDAAGNITIYNMILGCLR